MPMTWVVVAESSRAKIYALSAINAPLIEIDALIYPESRLNERNLTADYPGQRSDGKNLSGIHAWGTDESPKAEQAQRFSKCLAQYLKTQRGRYHYLVLVAPPKFLGLLRQDMNPGLKDSIIKTVTNNLVKQSPEQLKSYLPTQLPLSIH